MNSSTVIRDKVDVEFNNIADITLVSSISVLSSAYYGICITLVDGVEYHLTCKKGLPASLEYQIDEYSLLSNSEKYKCFSNLKKYI